MGLIIRHNLDNFFAALKHQSNMKVDIQSYRKGWFSSDVKLSVRNGLLINQNPQDQNTYTYDLHIVHGPLVRDMTSHHWTFAVAAIRLALSLPPQSAAIINSPIVSEGILTKNGLSSTFKILPASSNPHLSQWEGTTGQFNITKNPLNPDQFIIDTSSVFSPLAIKFFSRKLLAETKIIFSDLTIKSHTVLSKSDRYGIGTQTVT